jgi:predicted 3-demethylubiquinone-9 3-methyltransferase (glyoxalase superfamily)
MTRVTTSLMFVGAQAGKAEEAMNLYLSLFGDSRVIAVEHWGADEAESGVKQARFELGGREFTAMDSGAPHNFTFTPAVSLSVECETEEHLDRAWAALADGGAVLMELGPYPFSPKFGWLNDRYGVSWQLMLAQG